MDPETPTRQNSRGAQPNSQFVTPMRRVLQRVDELTPQSRFLPGLSPFNTPALQRLDESALRGRLREAYQMLKEKEKNLFLAATVGQELVDTNQQLQDSYERVQRELANAQQRITEFDDQSSSRLYGRGQSMAAQHLSERGDAACQEQTLAVNANGATTIDEHERQWIKMHVLPVKAQLQMAQERTDELLSEREDLMAEVYSLRQEHAAALRRAGDSMANTDDAQRRMEELEEEKAQLHQELDEQRTFWAKRWAEHQEERKVGAQAVSNSQLAEHRQAQDAAARIRAEKRADEMHVRCSTAQAELELLRSQMQRIEEERVNEWEPMRGRWLGCEEALQELQETHQSTCEALAQAEARLAELDKSNELNDPIKLKSEKTSTSLLGELDLQRHNAVAQQRALALEYTSLKRAYARALNTQSRMKQQVARLTQLAATGASEARMKRLEAALGEAECQQQALLWASMEQRRSVDVVMSANGARSEADGTALVTALRAKVKQIAAERDQSQRELRTAHLLRANEIQRTRDLEREAAESESNLRRALGELASIKADHDALWQAAKAGEKYADSQQGTPLTQPARKRTILGASPDSVSPSQMKSSPMSLEFMINSDFAKINKAQPLSSPSKSKVSKRRRIQDNSLGKETPCPSGHNSKGPRSTLGSSPPKPLAAEAQDLCDINNAADRGLESCLGALGTVRPPEPVAASGDSISNIEGDGTATLGNAHKYDKTYQPYESSSNGNIANNTTVVAADDICISTRSSHKPIECNNQ
ncbi:hypothetical protein LPJ66_003191 [Kickxella alabastrina]|uniref:Uncharacterized protein n=1 Tax=Kickxella alabastrina TaxID=61397 RepID=A0ACC1IMM0_9FUNG|nr:hypothetical protein LPJ66_003191 [Kickxella alabastrina]